MDVDEAICSVDWVLNVCICNFIRLYKNLKNYNYINLYRILIFILDPFFPPRYVLINTAMVCGERCSLMVFTNIL